jgi:hypothetical protein
MDLFSVFMPFLARTVGHNRIGNAGAFPAV